MQIEKTWDDRRLKDERLAQLQQTMREQGIGALYLTEGVNVRYILNLHIPGGAAFVPSEGVPIVFVRSLDEGYVRLAHPNVRPHLYRADPSDPEADAKSLRWADELGALMEEYGAPGEVLGLDRLDPIGFVALNRRGFRLENAEKVIERAKTVKTQDEVLIYWEMGKIYGSIMRYLQSELEPGVSEEEILRRVYSQVVLLGAEGLLQINVCSGENMNPWRRWPTARRFSDGDLVGMDLHIYGPGGYIYDSARTYLCGSKASNTYRELYRRAHDYNNGVIQRLRPGLSIADFKANLPAVPEEFHPVLYSFHIAHSNGLTPGEYPSIMKAHKPLDDVFRVNQVLSVDTVFAREGDDAAVKLEELVLLTEHGAVKMADMPYEGKLLGSSA